MPAVVDSNILYGWRNANDQHHAPARRIITATTDPRFPTLQIPRVFYQETIKHVHNELGYRDAIRTVEMIRDAPQLSVIDLRSEDYNMGKALFRAHDDLELPDATVVAYMRRNGIEYIYSLDDDFDRFDDITQLNTDINPFSS